jgi:hypothetical protein
MALDVDLSPNEHENSKAGTAALHSYANELKRFQNGGFHADGRKITIIT